MFNQKRYEKAKEARHFSKVITLEMAQEGYFKVDTLCDADLRSYANRHLFDKFVGTAREFKKVLKVRAI